MRKFFIIIFILIGIVTIGIGINLQLDSNSKEKNDSQPRKEPTIKAAFERINTFDQKQICTTYTQVQDYIRTPSYLKIKYNYPNCVHEYKLGNDYKVYQNEDKSVSITVNKEKKTLNNYINAKKTYIISLKNDDFYKDVTYTDIYETTTKNNQKVSLFEVNYQTTFIQYDKWYIGVEISDEYIITFEVESRNEILTYKAIEELFNNIEVEQKDVSLYTNSVLEGDYQIGTLRQNKKDSYEHGYKINYKVHKNYPEEPAYTTGDTTVSFQAKDIEKSFYTSMKIEESSTIKTTRETAEGNCERLGNGYEDNPEKYRNNKNTGLIDKTINGKNIYYCIYSYDSYLDNKKASTNENAYVYYEINDELYVSLYILNKNYKITDDFISQFLNFTVEEY